MRYLNSSKSLLLSLGISILLHLSLLAYLYYHRPVRGTESTPISVDILSSPKKELQILNQTRVTKALKRDSGSQKFVAPQDLIAPEKVSPPAKDIPPPPLESDHPESSDLPQVARETTNAPPSVETSKSTSYPTLRDLTPSLDQLAKMGEEKGKTDDEGEREEETVPLDSTDIKYTSYLNGVKFRVEGVWKYPEAAKRAALQGRGVVSFTIQRDGTLSELKLLSTSGYPILDEEILNAIRTAAPFNPMTENMRTKRLNIVATFEYNMAIQRIWGR